MIHDILSFRFNHEYNKKGAIACAEVADDPGGPGDVGATSGTPDVYPSRPEPGDWTRGQGPESVYKIRLVLRSFTDHTGAQYTSR